MEHMLKTLKVLDKGTLVYYTMTKEKLIAMIIKKIRVPVIKGNVRNVRGDIVLYSQLAFPLRIVGENSLH
jgi:hypothetical protein